MSCVAEDTVEFYWPKIDLRLRPYTANIKHDRDEFNYLKAEFSSEVAEYIRPHTENEGGALREHQPVEVYINDERRYHFYFRPEYVDYGNDGCWMDLHDPQKHLGEYEIDELYQGYRVKRIYRKIFEEARTKKIIKGVRFDIPEDKTTRYNPGQLFEDSANGSSEFSGGVAKTANGYPDSVETVDGETLVEILDAEFTVTFRSITCLKALWKLNDLIGLTSWIDNEGYLVVGSPEATGGVHVAAKDDSRVWRFGNVNISHPANPIRKVVVNGPMVDAKGGEGSVLSYLLPSEGGGALQDKDLLAQGIAQRTDLDDGKEISVERSGMTQNTLDALAYRVLLNEVRKQNSGSVKINPEISGKALSDYEAVDVGDRIQLIPGDDPDCEPEVFGEIYLIDGVEHAFSNGGWTINLDVKMYPDDPVIKKMRYFNPLSGDTSDQQVL